MSVVTLNFESQYLNSDHDITIILPNKPRDIAPKDYYANGKKYKVLWLLHGTYGDHSDWIRRTNIELYACEKDLVVVMPSALNSDYSNWENCMMGYNMYDYLIKELMPLVYNWFPVSDKREDNFIAGLSMGGRGTIKYAVNFPEKFAAAAALSAAPMNADELTEEYLNSDDMFAKRTKTDVDNAGGLQAFKDSCENDWRIIDSLVGTGKLPRFLFACGKEDKLIYEKLEKFEKHAKEINMDAEFWKVDGYRHEWRFWDLAIQHALDFFGLKDTGASPF